MLMYKKKERKYISGGTEDGNAETSLFLFASDKSRNTQGCKAVQSKIAGKTLFSQKHIF